MHNSEKEYVVEEEKEKMSGAKCEHDFLIIAWQYIYRADKEDEASSWADDPEERRRKLTKTYKKILVGKQARKVWCKKCDEVQYLNLPQDI